MGFKLKGAVDIRATPEPDAPLLITMFSQTLFGTGRTATDSAGTSWTNVLIPPGLLDGWVRDAEVAPAPDPGPLPLDPEMLVRQCLLVDRSLNAEPAIAPHFITADFLIARAIIETQMTLAKGTGSVLSGPFRLAQAEWNAFTGSGLTAAASFSAGDALYPMSQAFAAGFSMHADGKAFVAAAGDAAADDPVVASYLDLFHCYLLTPAIAVAVMRQQADATKTLGDCGASKSLAAAVAKRPRLAQVADTMPVPAFVQLTEALLTEALDAAFAEISKRAPDELPPDAPQTPGAPAENPWLAVATKELNAKVSEAATPDRVRSYFAATDFGPVAAGAIPAWCGAFAAFCMSQVGGEIPKGAARAANWKQWGQGSLPAGAHSIPKGAVVVMSPQPGTASSGHVGFFADASSDGQKLTLLGGNQSDAVTLAPFRVARVAAIRVGTATAAAAAAGAANSFDLTAAGVAKKFQPMGDKIVDRFKRAGLAKPQHLVAALANAIAESGLDPHAKAAGSEQSFGLFQCNITHGLGFGFTPEQLMDADTNIGIIIKAAKAVSAYVAASSTEAAVEAFVRFIERPKDRAGAVRTRLAIAAKLV